MADFHADRANHAIHAIPFAAPPIDVANVGGFNARTESSMGLDAV